MCNCNVAIKAKACEPGKCPTPTPPIPHVHAKLIKQWADNPSLTIEVWVTDRQEWVLIKPKYLCWNPEFEYRIQPRNFLHQDE